MPLVAMLLALAGAAAVPPAEKNLLVPVGPVAEAAVNVDPSLGGTGEIIYTTYAHEFNLFQGTEAVVNLSTTARRCATGPCGWLGTFHLPTGAQILRIELSACDSDPAVGVDFALYVTGRVPTPVVFLGPWATTGSIPGCATFTTPLSVPYTVVNHQEAYVFDVITNPGNVSWSQLRVIYRLQVSPAPATATFGDVPIGHPAFRFVEALAASGITGGCGGGNYCPDAPLTRAQMAVFLSSALGLHFPD